ncbi:MAG: RDD family protein [Cyclobacteriaceae bacterium]
MGANSKLDTFDRRRAGLLDLIAWQFLLIGPVILLMALTSNETIDLIAGWLYALTFILFISKDIFNGHSISKLSHGIRIVDSTTEEPVNELRTVIRNSTLILLLPIEFFMVLISPRRRIGDFIARTKLISSDKQSATERIRTFKTTELTKPRLTSLLVATGIALISFKLLNFLITGL